MDCPNCLTPWKCNGPHLEKSDSNYYKSSEGDWIFKPLLQKYVFIPLEKEYDENQLLDISNTLKLLNEEKYKSQNKRLEALQKLSDLDQELGLV